MSIQEAAVTVLRLYRVNFPLFNPYIEHARRSSALGRFRSMPAPSGFKLYDIDGRGEGPALSEMNARILMQVYFNLLFFNFCIFRQRLSAEWPATMNSSMRNAIGNAAIAKGNTG